MRGRQGSVGEQEEPAARHGDVRRGARGQLTEVGASGRTWTRAPVVEALLSERAAAPPPVDDVRAVALGEDVVLVTYLSGAPRPGTGAPPARRSSVWHRVDGTWRLRHHQGTPVPRGRPEGVARAD